MQLQVFLQRYAPVHTPGKTTTQDARYGPDGKRWFLKLSPNGHPLAPVAGFDMQGRPKSNHGDGIAIDLQLWDTSNNHGMGLTSNPLFWAWLSNPDMVTSPQWKIGTGSNAESFGLSWEIKSEPWHLKLCVPTPTQRVLDIEKFLAGVGKP
jgi:hypothetical protein